MATNNWHGEERYAYIEFPKGQKREVNGRTVYLPSYYVKRGQDTNQRHQASFLTPELAAQVIALYPNKPSRIHEEVRHNDDSTTPLPTQLSEVGEILPAQAFETAVKTALESLSKKEIQDIFKKAFAAKEPAKVEKSVEKTEPEKPSRAAQELEKRLDLPIGASFSPGTMTGEITE